MNTVTMSAVIVTLFLGGPERTGPVRPGLAVGHHLVLVKLLGFLFMFVWFRATLPRFRYDQLMDLGWKVLIPLALGWLLLLIAFRVGDDAGWNPVAIVAGGIAGLTAGYLLLTVALKAAKRTREIEGEVGV